MSLIFLSQLWQSCSMCCSQWPVKTKPASRHFVFSCISNICHNTQRYMTTGSLFPLYPYLTLLVFCFCLLFPAWVVLDLLSRELRLCQSVHILLNVIAQINTWMTYCIIGIALMQKIDLCIHISRCKLCTNISFRLLVLLLTSAQRSVNS